LAQQPYGIANFKRHLGKAHPMFLLKQDDVLRSYGADAVPLSSLNPTVPNTLLSYSIGGVTINELARSLARFCALGCFPLRVVDGPAMRDLLQTVLKRPGGAVAALPSRYKVTNALMQLSSEFDEDLSRRMATAVAGRASIPGQFAITMDSWTSRAVHGYLGVTIAYIDDAWTLQSAVIACAPLRTPHGGEVLSQALKQHLPVPASIEHVCAIVTDNGSNIVRAVELATGDRGVRCAAHTIQLVLRDVAKQEPIAPSWRTSSG
jgi:hypothetical protein